ncbi:MAG: MFS transporter [Thermoanaerobacteraceae bacterium]|nr:MFS transporter [Thermoanaerobacteraceae bacterium]
MNQQTWKAWLILMFFTMGTSMVSPLLPLYQQHFHLSKGNTVLIFAIYTFAVTPSMLLLGQLSDQLGRKRVIWPAMITVTLASALLGSVADPATLYLGRLLQGFALGAFLGTCTAFVVDLASQGKKEQAAIFAGVSFRLGFGLGPGLAGIMARYFPHPLTLPFAFHFLLMLASMAILPGIPETITRRQFRGISIRIGIPASMRISFLLFIAPSAFILTVLDSTVLSLAPLFIVEILGNHNLAVIGLVSFLVLGAGGFSQIPAASVPPLKSVIMGLLGGTTGLYLFFLAAWLKNVAFIIVAAALIGAAAGLIVKGGVTLCSLLVPIHERGRLLSSFYTACYLGMVVPLGTGYLADRIGLFQAMLALCLALTAIALILSLGTSRLVPYSLPETEDPLRAQQP